MKKVFFQGAFDMFHWMHLESIRLAREYGDYLIIGINSDELILEYKKKAPVFPYKYRAKIISSLKYVNEVIKMEQFKTLPTLEIVKPSIYVICEEWNNTKIEEKKFMEERGGEVKVLPYIEAEFMKEVKDKMQHNISKKLLNLCQECHRKI